MKKKLRAQQIVIDLPREGQEAWVNIVIQEVIRSEDGEVVNIIPRANFIHKTAQDIAYDVVQFNDLVLGRENYNISGYGLYSAIQSAVTKWMMDEFGGEVINGDLIVGEE